MGTEQIPSIPAYNDYFHQSTKIGIRPLRFLGRINAKDQPKPTIDAIAH